MSTVSSRVTQIESLPRAATGWQARWLRYASPAVALPLMQRWTPRLHWLAFIFTIAGLYIGLVLAPTDAQQGDAYRIIFVHVPVAWLSMLIYLAMAFWAAVGLVLNTRLSAMFASALAPTGASFTALALITGSLWGKPTWGTWWVWDARLTSELLLLFLYLGFMALQAGIADPRRADRAGALLVLVGVVNVPVIYFSVQWWNTLHQGASISLRSAPTMAATMLAGLLVMTLAFWLYAIATSFQRLAVLVQERQRAALHAQNFVGTYT